MATEITMPQMGFDMTEGVIANWLKAEGDAVQKGEAIAEIETDKTTIQIEAFGSGVLSKILAPVGAKVPVGQTIGLIGDPGETVSAPAAAAPAAPAAVPAAPTTTPATPAPVSSGPVNASPIARRMAEQLGVDLSLVKGSGAGGQIMKEDVEAFAAGKSQAPAATEGGRIVATPAAKKLAQDKQVDLHQVKGSGPEGRIVMADVNTYSAAAPKQPAPVAPAPQPQAVPQPQVAPAAPAPAAIPGDTRKPLTRIRQTIAQRMTNSKTTVPHFYITVAVEMDAALKLREQVNEALKSENIKVSVNDLIVRATAVALRRFPNLNSSFAGDAIVQHEQVHVGVAVALPSGLVTVTVRDADVKTLRQIAVEMSGLAARARDGKAQPGDMGGQTFTISNLGMYGVESFVAIVNPPDAGILAVGSSTPTPVVRDGQVTVRNIMHVTLSGDHRVTDGAEGAQFVNEIKRILENPWGLVL